MCQISGMKGRRRIDWLAVTGFILFGLIVAYTFLDP